MDKPPILISALLAATSGVRHAFFTRRGGVSRGIYASLNLGAGSGDRPEDVAENRRRAASVFDADADALNTCFQVHSARVNIAHGAWGQSRPRGDAIVTAVPGLVCCALAADCAPVLIVDAQARIVAAAHAGWKGALSGIVAATVAAMTDLGADPVRMTAAVGPCIGAASYEVGLEFLSRFEDKSPDSARFFGPGAGPTKRQFDLPGFVISQLRAAGVRDCEALGRDTCAEEDAFFSNRRANKRGEADYGRLLSAIMLKP